MSTVWFRVQVPSNGSRTVTNLRIGTASANDIQPQNRSTNYPTAIQLEPHYAAQAIRATEMEISTVGHPDSGKDLTLYYVLLLS